MGWRFRKSYNMGPFRVNLSKSGIGYSFGGKFFRVTKTASGQKRTTATLPGTGISYSQTGKKEVNAQDTMEIHNSNDELSKAIRSRVKFFFISMWCGLIATFATFLWLPSFLIALILYACGIIAFCSRIPIFYEGNSWGKNGWLCELLQSERVWLITNKTKKFVRVKRKSVFPISTNAPAFSIVDNNQRVIFLPDCICVVVGLKVLVLSYDDANISSRAFRWKEPARPAKDTEVLYTAWEHENKDGSKDKRFSANRKVPVCRYTHVSISDSDNFNLNLMCSRCLIEKTNPLL